MNVKSEMKIGERTRPACRLGRLAQAFVRLTLRLFPGFCGRKFSTGHRKQHASGVRSPGPTSTSVFEMNTTFSQKILGVPAQNGSVLIIVMWVAFGLVSLAIYFANSMSFELHAGENRVVAMQADEAIEAAAVYVSNVLATAEQVGFLPDPQLFQSEAVEVGNSRFWLIGSNTNDSQNGPTEMTFGLVDESSKINLNSANAEVLQLLPNMTAELAGAIVDWADADSTVSPGGAESETYSRLRPAYLCKNAPFETVDELRLVSGMNLKILFGEDANLNGILDANENDSDALPPSDNRDGRLDAGLLNFVTVSSREPNTTTNGGTKINITLPNRQPLSSPLFSLLQTNFGTARATQIMGLVGPAATSPLDFFVRGKLSQEDFAKIADQLTRTNGAYVEGLININTASKAVLACIPGIGLDKASSVIAYRQSNPDKLATVAWLVETIEPKNATLAGPYVTVHSYQFTADVAAVGENGRGFRRVKFIFDTSDGTPKIIYRQDLTHLGWALGSQTRRQLLALQTR